MQTGKPLRSVIGWLKASVKASKISVVENGTQKVETNGFLIFRHENQYNIKVYIRDIVINPGPSQSEYSNKVNHIFCFPVIIKVKFTSYFCLSSLQYILIKKNTLLLKNTNPHLSLQ